MDTLKGYSLFCSLVKVKRFFNKGDKWQRGLGKKRTIMQKKWKQVMGVWIGCLVLIGCDSVNEEEPDDIDDDINNGSSNEGERDVEDLRVSDDYFELSGSKEVTEEHLVQIFDHKDRVDEENGYRLEGEFHLIDFETENHWHQTMEAERIREDQEKKDIHSQRNGEETFEGEYYVNLEQVNRYTYQRLNQEEWEAVMRPELYTSSPSYMNVMQKIPDNLSLLQTSLEEGKLILTYSGSAGEELYIEQANERTIPTQIDPLLSYPYTRARDDEGEVIFETTDRLHLEEATLHFRAEFNEETYFLEHLYYELEQDDFLHIYDVEFSEWDEVEEIQIPDEVVEEAVEVMPY